MKRKIILSIFLMAILIANISFASYSTVTMSVVEEPICTIDLGENAKFEKKLVGKDLANKEVTLQLQVTNENVSTIPDGEIMLVIDNSASMNNETSTGSVRRDLVFESAKSLVSKILENTNKFKIGVVRFSTTTTVANEGTSEDASLVSQLSNNAAELNSAIDNIATDGPRTDLQSGLRLASEQFSNDNTTKYIIVLTDGVPNVSLGFSKTGTETDGYYYSQYVIDQTKNELSSLQAKGVNVFTMLSGIDDENHVTDATGKTYKQIIDEIFVK